MRERKVVSKTVHVRDLPHVINWNLHKHNKILRATKPTDVVFKGPKKKRIERFRYRWTYHSQKVVENGVPVMLRKEKQVIMDWKLVQLIQHLYKNKPLPEGLESFKEKHLFFKQMWLDGKYQEKYPPNPASKKKKSKKKSGTSHKATVLIRKKNQDHKQLVAVG